MVTEVNEQDGDEEDELIEDEADSTEDELQQRFNHGEWAEVPILLAGGDYHTGWANRAMLDIFGTQPGDPLPETLEPVYPSREAYLRVGGEVAACIFGQTQAQTTDYAHRLGLAFQLTNIVRDVGEDATRGRIYPKQGWSSDIHIAILNQSWKVFIKECE